MNTRSLALVLVLSPLFAACGTSTPETPPADGAPHGAPPHGAAPHGDAPAADRAAPTPAGNALALSGTIRFAGTFPGTAVFVSVKDPKNPGPPLAAKQLPPGPFPMSFTLDAADVVQMGPVPREMPATVALTVRFDADGNAMSKDPSEPSVTLETPAAASDLSLDLAVLPH